MGKRKQVIIDKKFQFKTTFSIIGVVTIITAFIIGAIAVSIVYNNIKLENIHVLEDKIVHYLSQAPTQEKIDHQARRGVFLNHVKNLKTMKRIIKYNKILMVVLILMVIAQGIILYLLLIRKTHRISGPIYVMSNYMKEIIDGKMPQTRQLREKDELKDFYDIFVEMVETLKKK